MHLFRIVFAALMACCFSTALAQAAPPAPAALSIGETWTIESVSLGETRRINVYIPAGLPSGTVLPVMIMPDGGMLEDFLHVAGLLQVGASNGTTRPFLLVGIENTERRRDLTGPTANAKDRTIAPRVGGSQAFRRFIRTELLPEVARRYRTAGPSAIVGESLAGLFVVETFMLEPDLFDIYIAIDPSLWWNDGQLARQMAARPPRAPGKKALYIAASADGRPGIDVAALQASFAKTPAISFSYEDWPGETHATVYHPAALRAFRAVLKPAAAP